MFVPHIIWLFPILKMTGFASGEKKEFPIKSVFPIGTQMIFTEVKFPSSLVSLG